jgi:hypothetical protein
VIESLQLRYTPFLPDGTPIHAAAKLRMKAAETAAAAAPPVAPSPAAGG